MSNSNAVFENLDEDRVHVWRISLRDPKAASKILLLSKDEQERAQNFTLPLLRCRYILSHVALRAILASYLQAEPCDVLLKTTAQGKPMLSDEGSPIRFNLSHSHEQALVAVSKNAEVGVDIERVRELRNLDAFSSRFLTQSEQCHLLNYSSPSRLIEFFKIWTAKEAYLKAKGVGLAGELKDFDISVMGDALEISLQKESTLKCSVSLLQVEAGYAASMVVHRAKVEICYFDWIDDV